MASALAGIVLACSGASGDFEQAAAVAVPLAAMPLPAASLMPRFHETLIDDAMAGDCKAIGDIDGDGRPDLVVGGATLVWYRNPDWRKAVIAKADTEFTTDCQARDLNGDGRIDIVTADGQGKDNVVWFENPGAGPRWVRHVIGTHGQWVHDLEVDDFDRDGRPDVLTHGNGTHLWYQGRPGDWTGRDLGALGRTKEGVGIGDVDGDGRTDFVQGGWWFGNPGGRGTWAAHRFAEGYDGGSYSAALGDLDGDGRTDIVLSEQHKRHPLAWFRAPADPRGGRWSRHVLDGDIGAHKIQLSDLNGDGRLDIVAGLELAELRLYVSRGAPGAAPVFARVTLNRTGCHNTRVADVDLNGRPDILCANYIGHPPVSLWLNQPIPGLAQDRWRHIAVDATRARPASGVPAFGLGFGDVDGDGLTDIVSGRYAYRNPGSRLSDPWKRSPFPVEADAMLVLDVDDDGRSDVIAQALPKVYWLKPNGAGTAWAPHAVADLVPTEHGNSQGYRLARILPGSRRPELVFTTGDGIWYLRVPADPRVVPWPAVKIAADTTEDVLAVGDIDADGLDDVVASAKADGKRLLWYRNPGSGAGSWLQHKVGDVAGWADRAELADLNGDGRLDVVVSTENGKATGAATYWFEAPRGVAAQPWTRREIAVQGSTNSMSVGNVDGTGPLEVVTGEHKGAQRVRIWSTGDGGRTWGDSLVGSGKESHLGARLVDLDNDGALEIVSIGWDDFASLHVWRREAERAVDGPRSGAPIDSGSLPPR